MIKMISKFHIFPVGVASRLSLMVLSLALVGCGSSKTPEEKCEDFLSVVCDRGVECLPGETLSHSSCVDTLETVIPCGMVESVADSFDSCMEKVETNGCATLFPRDEQGDAALVLPADCTGVLEGPGSFGGDVRISARSSRGFGPGLGGAAR